MGNDKLKRCPFCGEDVASLISNYEMKEMYKDNWIDWNFEDWGDGGYVICNAKDNGCGSMGGWGLTAEDAIEIWNRRV